MAYSKVAVVTANVTTAAAVQYNSLMAEMKAAALGIPTHNYTVVRTYTGWKLNTITVTDNSPAGDAGYDITLVGTATYTGYKLTQMTWVFNVGEMNITMTEVFTYTGWKLTNIEGTTS